MLSVGCVRKDLPPGSQTVYELELQGVEQVDESALESGLATQRSPRFLLLWDGVAFDYELFEQSALEKDLERIVRFYRARGFYEARVTAARVIPMGARRVRIEITVEEGQPVLVSELLPMGLAEIPFSVSASVLESIELSPGDRFDETALERSKQRILSALKDEGFAFAKVETQAEVDLPSRTARISFQIAPGNAARFGPIHIQGLREISESIVRKNLQLRPDQAYSAADIADAQAALLNLGVFSSVQIEEDLSRPQGSVVPLVVKVEEALLRAVRLGGGLRLDPLRLAFYGLAGWEHRNLFGGLRHFEITAQPGVTLFPTSLNQLDRAPTRPLFENSIGTSLRQPSFIEGRTSGRLSAEYNVFPLLFPIESGVDPDDEVVIGYNQLRTRAGLERAFFGHRLVVAPSYNFQANFPFTYQGNVPAGLDSVKVSFPELDTRLDFRDHPVETKNGVLFSNRLQVAGYVFGGTVSDVRIRPEIRAFRELIAGRLVLATRASVGLLFPGNFGSTLNPQSTAGEQLTRDPADPAVIRDQHKLLFRAFYSGGPNSNRGYPFRGVGPHGPVGFLVPRGVRCGTVQPDGETVSLSRQDLEERGCIRPLGGLSLWEASVELRFLLDGPVSGLFFLDASDVTENVLDFRSFRVPHLSLGPGLRYMTPVGPLRLDIGFRWPGLQTESAADDGDAFFPDREPEPLIRNAPLFGDINATIHLAIGEAF